MDKDARFSHIATDPKFRRIPKGERKVKIDKRFQSMFKDKKFNVKYTVDKRGRPVNHTSSEDLKRYYELSSEDDDDEEKEQPQSDDDDEERNETGRYVKAPQSTTESNEEDVVDALNIKRKNDRKLPDKVKKKLKDLNVDYARGEGTLLSGSSSDDDTDSEYNSDSDGGLDHAWGELDREAESTDVITRRLAVCNMDWDRIRAVDLMVLLNSFVPPNGIIESITIYPSEFGIERMKEEELKGPTELVENRTNADETEDGTKYHMEKLRQYQLNRLKYYYAVVVTDCPATANNIYEECDGHEYESSSTKIDLRFIPDDTAFEREPKEICNNLPDKYEPRLFTTTALQQGKVNLTWDEANFERSELTDRLASGKIDDISEVDMKNYLASSSGEDTGDEKESLNSDDDADDGNANPIDKYKLLLEDIEKQEEAKKNRDVGLEISWGTDLKVRTDRLKKERESEGIERTPFEQFLEKRKEKKKTKKAEKLKKRTVNSDDEYSDDVPSDVDMNDPYFAEEFNNSEFKKKPKSKNVTHSDEDDDDDECKQNRAKLELLLMNEKEDDRSHFSLMSIQKNESDSKSKKKRFKKKNKNAVEPLKTDDFNINVTDDRFSALYSSHHFNIDPTDPHYKKTKGMDALIEEKLKRRNDDDGTDVVASKKTKVDSQSKAELNVLVKSIKRKTELLNRKK